MRPPGRSRLPRRRTDIPAGVPIAEPPKCVKEHRKKPTAGAWAGSELRYVHFLAGDELEQRGLSPLGRSDAALDGCDDLARLLHPLAVTAEGPRHGRVVPGNVGC